MTEHAPATIAVILKGYPRLSETFIAQELHGLERRGARLHLYALRRPTDRATHPIHARIHAPVTYLPEYLHDDPIRVLSAAKAARTYPGLQSALRCFWHDVKRQPTRDRIRRFGQALVLANDLSPAITHLYAHFLHTPASVTRYAAMIRGLPWSYSAHAKDIWTTPDWDKQDKLQTAAWGVTCTAAGRDHLATLAQSRAPMLVHHGLSLDALPQPRARMSGANNTDPAMPVRLLTIARAVEKKGLDDLLTALSYLKAAWVWTHIGAGPDLEQLKAHAAHLGLADRITWRGALPQADVFAALAQADLFVLPSRVARDGDRDGIPNVLMEAMSQGVPCLATTAGGIPELIAHGRTGWLVPPRDPAALADALTALIASPQDRTRIGQAGRSHLTAHFDAAAGLDRLAALFGLPQPSRSPAPHRTAP